MHDLQLPILKFQTETNYRYPSTFEHEAQFKETVLEFLAHNASDILIKQGAPISGKVNGALCALSTRTLNFNEVERIALWASGSSSVLTELASKKAINTRYEVFHPTMLTTGGQKQRFGYRVNISPIYIQGKTTAEIIMRSIPLDPLLLSDVGLAPELVNQMCPDNGIVIVAGKTSSGKTTTFSAIIRYIMENDTPIKGHILTHEDPIEFVYDNIKSSHSIIAQSQIPEQFSSFAIANQEALRRTPNLIMIGELRDKQSIESAFEAANTGHPVFATVHSQNCSSVMRRLISRFDESVRGAAIYDLVETTRFIMAQTLVRKKDGNLVAAREHLNFTPDIREHLLSLQDMGNIASEVRRLVEEHGHPFSLEAEKLHSEGLIDGHVAKRLSMM
ncbi:ATPase, T2SS/T4P/T4SS family [Yersinia enterocolitica]|uniref:ATPase, T2SS/T4P/T4SS family n=1 Tax=Yersinia TaxID=629 RepID=UPI0005E07FF0|nr:MULTISPECIES: ATPase, T2SS/T4P/T4SS family [Yersinia]EKN3395567.1 Flp pilus assembly complex ATPase component TadA [Yersinia enterocolitica]EKN3501130.1 Flp pilus assembly complex ATPase component TadA [Yersinia enterocolitica]EKN3636582.1 Flp pilus assembly complex ATPase component TadA [Yersinia enterocolitica]EKN3687144.1 Flp pilus assembly complex ATPase component TadA [Yersinia enterocolitica]EKN3832478.1 Flp pilus assembly complex ATPase component TadA [Yersinia enterocolitica]